MWIDCYCVCLCCGCSVCVIDKCVYEKIKENLWGVMKWKIPNYLSLRKLRKKNVV